MTRTTREWQYCTSGGNVDYIIGEMMIARNPSITFGELADALVSADTFDTAIPQGFWRDRLDATGINISGHVVTTYGPNDFFPLTLDGALALYGPDQVGGEAKWLHRLDLVGDRIERESTYRAEGPTSRRLARIGDLGLIADQGRVLLPHEWVWPTESTRSPSTSLRGLTRSIPSRLCARRID